MFFHRIFFVVLVVTTYEKILSDATNDGSACRPHWLQLGQRCLRVGQVKVDHEGARLLCILLHPQGKLMTIRSKADQDVVLQILLNSKKDRLWIGLHYKWRRNNKSSYEWLDGSSVSYSNWGHAVDMFTRMERGRYVAVRAPGGKWHAEKEGSNNPLCVAPALPEVVKEKCPGSHGQFSKLENTCYLIVDQKKTWQEAEDYCKSWDSHLLTIKDSQRNEHFWKERGLNKVPSVWIGLRSKRMNPFLSWSDSSPAFYWNWGNNEPLEIEADRCAAFSTDVAKWFVAPCDEKLAFICEHKIGESVWTLGPAGRGRCPDGEWRDFGGDFCYFYGNKAVNWIEARKECHAMKSDLLSVHSAKENEILARSLKELGDAWIGLRDTFHSGSKWSDWTPMDYVTEFESYHLPAHTNCGVLTPSGKWLGKNCTSYQPPIFICKIKKR